MFHFWKNKHHLKYLVDFIQIYCCCLFLHVKIIWSSFHNTDPLRKVTVRKYWLGVCAQIGIIYKDPFYNGIPILTYLVIELISNLNIPHLKMNSSLAGVIFAMVWLAFEEWMAERVLWSQYYMAITKILTDHKLWRLMSFLKPCVLTWILWEPMVARNLSLFYTIFLVFSLLL